MLSGLSLATARRLWFVPELLVSGDPSLGQLPILTATAESGQMTIGFSQLVVAGGEQRVRYDSLFDHRGFRLPESIPGAHVLLRPRSSGQAWIVGRETDESFLIARDPSIGRTITTDLLVIELGSA